MKFESLKEFGIYFGVPADCFVGLDVSVLPPVDESVPDCANLLSLFKFTVEQIKKTDKKEKELVEKLRKLKFWSAFYAVGIYEDAQEEEVDVATLEYIENDENTRFFLGGAYEAVSLGYVLGKHVKCDGEKAKKYLEISKIYLGKAD